LVKISEKISEESSWKREKQNWKGKIGNRDRLKKKINNSKVIMIFFSYSSNLSSFWEKK
jgi:hypothetical protein